MSAKDDPFSPEYVPPTAQKLAAPIRVETQTAWSSSSAFSERRKTISKSFDQYRMEQAEASQKAQEMAALDFEKVRLILHYVPRGAISSSLVRSTLATQRLRLCILLPPPLSTSPRL